MKFQQLANTVCRDIPEGWHIEIHLEQGSGYATLFNNNGTGKDSEVEHPGDNNDLGIERSVLEALAYARRGGRDEEFLSKDSLERIGQEELNPLVDALGHEPAKTLVSEVGITKTCEYCQHPVFIDNKFCGFCGVPLSKLPLGEPNE